MEELLSTRLRLRQKSLEEIIQETEKLIQDGVPVELQEFVRYRTTIQGLSKSLSDDTLLYVEKCPGQSSIDMTTLVNCQLRAEKLLLTLEASERSHVMEQPPASTTEPVQNHARLPKLDLVTFDGNILMWTSFWDSFEASVHKKNIPEVEKLSYLLCSLKGVARQAVDGLEITNSNYEIARKILENQFGKRQRVILAHYKALQFLPKAQEASADCRRTYNEIEKHLRVLEAMGEGMESNYLRFIITSKFPEKITYQVDLNTTDESTIDTLRKEFNKVISVREKNETPVNTEPANVPTTSTPSTSTLYMRSGKGQEVRKRNWQQANKKPEERSSHAKPRQQKQHQSHQPKRPRWTCIFCNDHDHLSEECNKYKTYVERKGKLQNRCYICFRQGHRATVCTFKKKCVHCGKMHNRALCHQKTSGQGEHIDDSMNTVAFVNKYMSNHLLQTAVVQIKTGSNQSLPCRLLLDSGSQRSYITTRLFNKLHIRPDEEDSLMIYTFGSSVPSEIISPSAEIIIVTKRQIERKMRVNIVPHITDRVPIAQIESTRIDVVADDDSIGETIDLLIGNDLYLSFLKNKIIKIRDEIYLADSELGWLVSGNRIESTEDDNVLSVVTYCHCHDTSCPYFTEPDLPLRSIDIKFLWSLESIGITDSPKTSCEEESVQHFNETAKYDKGRYQVKWPWIQYPPELPTNYGMAYGRLKGLMKRLDENALNDYNQILKEQLEANVIEVVDSSEYYQDKHPVHYLPHHMVKQRDKRGRIVYDASAKTKDEKSLNECLYRGPSMLEDLTGLILNFRLGKVGITADVEKAFLQVGLQREDRDVTRFLWVKDTQREVTDDNIVQYRFCRVPFGIISSPFLLTATIRHHISRTNPPLLNKIADKCYVDNLVTSTKSTNEGLELYDETRKTFDELGMNIRDWVSNDQNFMNKIPKQQVAKQTEKVKILGLIWHLKRDTLQLKFDETAHENGLSERGITKKGVLRVLARLYDPCGFISPLILPGKLLFQELCARKLKWDENLPTDLQEQWTTIVENLKAINDFKLPRYIGSEMKDDSLEYELHGFSDASINAHATVVYIRMKGKRKIKTAFLMSKCRINPIEDRDDLKIPRLELLGFLIGIRLLKYIKGHLNIEISKINLWTDSQVVLAWTKTNKLLPPFVLRRINEIKQIRDSLNIELSYVNTRENPADIATRPELWHKKQDLWINGPNFLTHEQKYWPKTYNTEDADICLAGSAMDIVDTPEMSVKGYEDQEVISLFPEYQAIPMEDTHRSDKNVQSEEEKIKNEIRELQKCYFPDEVLGKPTSLLKNLGLFLDEEKILRSRGRLANTNWPRDKKFPILIPRKSPFTHRTIQKIHEDNYHVGVPHTLSLLRNKYWVPQGRAQVKGIIEKCQQCKRHAGGPYKIPPPPALPSERVNYSSPFTYVGLDYLGPILVETPNSREKRWICIFTCLAVRAIHLEMVKNLSAEEFLLALRRFTAARGIPNTIISDNALQFKLTSEVLTSSYCIDNSIKWKFIAQLAPWQGGFYERLVALVKHCLKRTLDKHLLTDNQMLTVVKEIEAVLNTRPLTSVGSDLEEVLRPADFLSLGQCLEVDPTLPESVLQGTSTKVDLIKGWKKGQTILEEYKKMFVNQYLPSLREKSFHTHKQPRVKSDRTPQIGDIVQIKEDTRNRINWKVGKIVAVIKGRDGESRVAKVKVGNTEYTRSVGHLYPLEADMDLDQTEQRKAHQLDPSITSDQPDQRIDTCDINPDTSLRTRVIPEEIIVPQDEKKTEQVCPSEVSAPSEPVSLTQPEPIHSIPDDPVTPDQMDVEEELPSAEVDDVQMEHDTRRRAAIRAREKIAEWTRLLLSLL